MEYHVPSVELSARILKLLSRYKYKTCSLTEITDKLKVNKTTCLRVLRTLEHQDFVSYDQDTKKYSLGPYLIPLGNRASELINHVAIAKSQLKVVSVDTGLTTVLVQRLQDNRLIYIASAEPPNEEVRIAVSVGQQFPIIGAAFGKCFLAFDEEEDWRPLLTKRVMVYKPSSVPNPPQTIVDPDQFAASLAEVRQNGYSLTHGELTPGFSAVAAPIFGSGKEVVLVVACLAVTALFEDEAEQKRVIETVRATSQRLSEWIS